MGSLFAPLHGAMCFFVGQNALVAFLAFATCFAILVLLILGENKGILGKFIMIAVGVAGLIALPAILGQIFTDLSGWLSC